MCGAILCSTLLLSLKIEIICYVISCASFINLLCHALFSISFCCGTIFLLLNVIMLNIITYATWQEERGQAQTHLVEVHVFRSASLNRALDSTMK